MQHYRPLRRLAPRPRRCAAPPARRSAVTALGLAFGLVGCTVETTNREIEAGGDDRDGASIWIDAVVSSGPSSGALPHGVVAVGAAAGKIELHFATEDGYLADDPALRIGLEFVDVDGEVFPVDASVGAIYSVVEFHHGVAAFPPGRIGSLRAHVNGEIVESPDMIYSLLPGDADLDFDFDSADLTTVLAAGKYETGAAATWEQGDWNGDGMFDTGDFVIALALGKYELGKLDVEPLQPSPGHLTDDHEPSLPPNMAGRPAIECAGQCFLVAQNVRDPAREDVSIHGTCAPLLWNDDDEDYGGEHESNVLYDFNQCASGVGEPDCYAEGDITASHDWNGSFNAFADCVYYRRGGGEGDPCLDRGCSVEVASRAGATTDVAAWNGESSFASASSSARVEFQVFDANDKSVVNHEVTSSAHTGEQDCNLGEKLANAAYLNLFCELSYPVDKSKCSARAGVQLTLAEFLDAMACVAGYDEDSGFIPRHIAELRYDSPKDDRPGLVDIPASQSQVSLGPVSLEVHTEYAISRKYDHGDEYWPLAGARASTEARVELYARGIAETGAPKADLACGVGTPGVVPQGWSGGEPIERPTDTIRYGTAFVLTPPDLVPTADPNPPTWQENCEAGELCGANSAAYCDNKYVGQRCENYPAGGEAVKTCAPAEGTGDACVCAFHD